MPGLDDRIITRHSVYLLKVRAGELELDAFEQCLMYSWMR
jgi:hypothetical protein